MKKHALPKIIIASVLSLTLGTTFALSRWEQKTEPVVQTLAGEGNYYSGISDSLTGTDLLNALHDLNSRKRTRTVGYDGMKTFAAKCDADPDGSGKIIGFYDNTKLGPNWDSAATWNREHVWPNVRDGDLVENDAHMVRPASVSTNTGRGSKGFGTESYDPGTSVNYYRGAAARIIFYAAIAVTSLQVVDFPFNYDGVGNGNHGYPVGSMGSLSDMLLWNLQYQPQDTSFTGANDLARRTELNRNEVIQNNSSGQGNRNPFIDHPEYACKIWGNTNDKTRQICGLNTETPTSITLNNSSASIKVGGTYQLNVTSVTPTNGDRSVTWSSSDNSTASVSSSGLVTGIKEGQATITATSVKNTNVKATCVVNVTTDPNSPTSIELSETEMELPVDWVDMLTVTKVVPETASKEVNWSSSDDTVVTVVSGYLTTLKPGTAVITATSKVNPSVFATCNITVIQNGGGEDDSSSSEEVPPTSDSEPSKPDDKKKGCFGSLSMTSIFIPIVLGISLITLVIFRKKEDK